MKKQEYRVTKTKDQIDAIIKANKKLHLIRIHDEAKVGRRRRY